MAKLLEKLFYEFQENILENLYKYSWRTTLITFLKDLLKVSRAICKQFPEEIIDQLLANAIGKTMEIFLKNNFNNFKENLKETLYELLQIYVVMTKGVPGGFSGPIPEESVNSDMWEFSMENLKTFPTDGLLEKNTCTRF